jgi:hypothetical protein
MLVAAGTHTEIAESHQPLLVPRIVMNPEHCPPFFVPDQNQNPVKSQATRSIPHAEHVPITGLFGPTLAEFNQPTSTTIALQD